MTQLQAERHEPVLLERVLKFWESNRETLTQQYPNKWLLIKGAQLVGRYDTYKEALDACGTVEAPLMQFVTTSVEEPTYSLPSVYITSVDA